MSLTGSITKLISRVKHGDGAASEALVARYIRRLLGLARAKLRGKWLRECDEEDVVQSALIGFFLGVERGQYRELHDREDLWHLLVKITARKVQKLVRQHKMQKRHPGKRRDGTPSSQSAETVLPDPRVERILDPNLSPDLELIAKEEIEHLLESLGDGKLRSIAIWKWEGYTNEEIAARLGCKSRTIERKLKLIRTIWAEEDVP